jgi:hypothetical protein
VEGQWCEGTLLGDDLAVVVGGHAAHVVVDGGENGNGLLGHVDAGEDLGGLADAGQTLGEDVRGDVREIEEHVVLVLTDAAAGTDLEGDGPGHDVARGQILGGRGITLHEPLTIAVPQDTALTTRA